MTDRIRGNAEVEAALDGERLDQAAAQLFSEYSRSRLQSWIKRGELLADGKVCRPRDKVREGSLLTIDAVLEDEVSWQPEAVALDILFEDESILVLNKPAGLVVHPAAGHADGTLVNALIGHAPTMAQLPRGGIVHRLDMETSGVMVAAKTLRAHHHLVAQLQARTVKRQYCAVCIGAMTGGGTVDEPIGRHPRQRKKMAVVHGGKPAVTHYRVTRRYAHHTRIAVNLETGRTHQIRVHMAFRHYPLIGDPVYGGRPRIPRGASEELINALRGFPRQALHAEALGLIHPASGENMQFDCPLPDDLKALLAVLEAEDVEPRPD
ncbi:MAG: 23S rRNA pseudouridine(1911/1915/1917) synthase RluD [Haliea sp.]|jgi:23S rRNA pseudouridine1911/1915/1917 synthase|nr:23S rRNA pseudouridine(1911/1915/1917) synthase RluD [Haliea sp.]MDP5064740.1 23S rRNA pseudouridine(1911/1915/1917) synthase RluD [Haliea sp.]